MNEEELKQIEQRTDAATPGPWFWDINRRYKHVMLKAPQDGGTCVMDFVRWGMQSAQPRFNDTQKIFGGILRTADEYDQDESLSNPNGDFIAHARQDVPTLLAEVRRLQAENERLRRALMNIESAKKIHSGIPWEAMTITLQDIARQALKGGEK